MKKKDKEQLRAKNTQELLKLLVQKKQEMGKAETEVKGGTEKNLKKVWNLRREIAIISTLMTEKNFMERQEQAKDRDSQQKVK